MAFEIESNDQISNGETIYGLQHGGSFSSNLEQVTSSELFETAFDITSYFSENPFSEEPIEQPTLGLGNFNSLALTDASNNNSLGALFSFTSKEETETNSALEERVEGETQRAEEKSKGTESTESLIEGLESANEGRLIEEVSKNVILTAEDDIKTAEDSLDTAEMKRNKAAALNDLNSVESSLIAEELPVWNDFRVDILETIIESSFGKIYIKGSDLPFSQHPPLIKELKEELRNRLPSEANDKLINTIKKYLSNLELYRFNANGEKVPLSSEEKEKIASEIEKHFYLFDTQKPVDNKKESSEKEFRAQDRHDIDRAPVTQLNGQAYAQEARAQTGPITPLAFFVVDETRILSAAKKEQKIKEQQIDLVERIKETVIKKEILKKEILNHEINRNSVFKAAPLHIPVQPKIGITKRSSV